MAVLYTSARETKVLRNGSFEILSSRAQEELRQPRWTIRQGEPSPRAALGNCRRDESSKWSSYSACEESKYVLTPNGNSSRNSSVDEELDDFQAIVPRERTYGVASRGDPAEGTAATSARKRACPVCPGNTAQ
jgi:hypothetical protein